MSTELTTLNDLINLPITTSLASLAKYQVPEWLQRIQLISKGKYVDQQKIAPGNYGVPQAGEGDEILDLSSSIDVIPFAIRDKALDMNEDPPIVVYDSDSDLFKNIQARSEEKDSGCMWGPVFLVFERVTGQFYELYFGSKSSRREAGKIAPFLPITNKQAEIFGLKPQIPRPLTLTSKYIKSGKFAWHVPVVSACSTPFTNLPQVQKIESQIIKFMGTKPTNAEVVSEEVRDR